jgi:hypothetical protein
MISSFSVSSGPRRTSSDYAEGTDLLDHLRGRGRLVAAAACGRRAKRLKVSGGGGKVCWNSAQLISGAARQVCRRAIAWCTISACRRHAGATPRNEAGGARYTSSNT